MGPVVCVEDVATALQLPPVTYAAWLREVRRGAGAAEVGGGEEMRTEIDFRRFIDFLETGDLVRYGGTQTASLLFIPLIFIATIERLNCNSFAHGRAATTP